ncbi:hypothetical protein HHI36_004659 [Cryptolaemus montrouzieri]|uniref:Uncharacterized protein n=1 Tax=Cryptolaemus montrouzieri TaxID=559131 RepID=A0ABD2NTE4_9CUCU
MKNISEDLQANLGNEYEVEIPKKKNPRIKIIGLKKEMPADQEKLINNIILQNGLGTSSDQRIIEMVTLYENKKEKMDVILEMDPDTYSTISNKCRFECEWKLLVYWLEIVCLQRYYKGSFSATSVEGLDILRNSATVIDQYALNAQVIIGRPIAEMKKLCVLIKKLKEEELIITKGDKRNCIVIVKKEVYKQEILKFLNNNRIKEKMIAISTFIKRTEELLKGVEFKFWNQLIKKLSLENTNFPVLYGLMKLHRCIQRPPATCDGINGPCLVTVDVYLKTVIFSIHLGCMVLTVILGLFVFKHRKTKAISTGMWTILEIILLGACILYSTVSTEYQISDSLSVLLRV